MLKFQFLGAAQQVTGSRHFLEIDGVKILVDCGMFQSRDSQKYNWDFSPLVPRELDAVVLTHAHLDHCGLLPKLVKEGFRGVILATPATAELTELILRDSAYIQQEDVKYKKKRHKKEKRQSPFPLEPLYELKDVEKTLPLIKTFNYEKKITLDSFVKKDTTVEIHFHDAGHILGSASIEITADRDGKQRRVLFSGDLGQWDRPLVGNPTLHQHADYVVVESTYGNRQHHTRKNIFDQLAEVINRTIERGGKVVIPIFAVERAQEMLYYLEQLVDQNRIPNVPVYLDSPMAAEATKIFKKYRHLFDEDVKRTLADDHAPLTFDSLQICRTQQDSMAINQLGKPAVILATAGMCNAGRIKHHLKHEITKKNSTVVFVGYQAEGTLGRQIVDKRATRVRILGKELQVKAEIQRIHGFSGHAGQDDLIKWLTSFNSSPRKVFVVHGEEESAKEFAQLVHDKLGLDAIVPEVGEIFEE